MIGFENIDQNKMVFNLINKLYFAIFLLMKWVCICLCSPINNSVIISTALNDLYWIVINVFRPLPDMTYNMQNGGCLARSSNCSSQVTVGFELIVDWCTFLFFILYDVAFWFFVLVFLFQIFVCIGHLVY